MSLTSIHKELHHSFIHQKSQHEMYLSTKYKDGVLYKSEISTDIVVPHAYSLFCCYYQNLTTKASSSFTHSLCPSILSPTFSQMITQKRYSLLLNGQETLDLGSDVSCSIPSALFLEIVGSTTSIAIKCHRTSVSHCKPSKIINWY